MKIIFTLIFVMICALGICAQDNVDFGIWQDFQVTKPVNKTTDVIFGVRFDTKRNTRSFAEQRGYFGFNFKYGRFSVQPGLMVLKNFSKKPYHEVRPQVTIGYRFTTANKINISSRVRIEYHSKLNLPDDGRVVPLLSIDRKISKKYSLFNTDEFWLPVHNPRDVAKYRKRLFFGVTRSVNSHLAVDVFYLYQRDEQVAPKNNHKLGFTWKIKL